MADSIDSPDDPVEVVPVEPTSGHAANAAIVAATEAALAMPELPGRDEFLNLATQARMLSLSGAAPEAVRGDPHIAFHVAMVGRDLGISPSAALNLIDVISSRNGPQLSLSPQLLNGQIRRLGLGSIIPIIREADRCVVAALGPGGSYDPRCKPLYPAHADDCRCRGLLGESEFTWADAQMAGLVSPDCEPDNHSQPCRSWSRGKMCNSGYKSYPKRMMMWRASGFAADDYFPEASLGLYSPEALGQTVDADGRMIDPAHVALPDGYGGPADVDDEPANPDDLADLKARIAALPDEQRLALRERWVDNQRLRGRTVDALPASLVNLVRAMVEGFEAQATRTPTPPPTPATDDDQVDTEAVEDEPAKDKPEQDPDIAGWVRSVAETAPAELVTSTTAEVKAMHHATVNSELTERHFDPTGIHIDTRRMALTAAMIEEATLPDRCVAIGCDSEAVGLFCEAHQDAPETAAG